MTSQHTKQKANRYQDELHKTEAEKRQLTLETCTYCPKLCRDVCPVAIGESRETLIPTHKMSLLALAQTDQIPHDQELAEIAFACTNCGACTAVCKHDMEPASALFHKRHELLSQGITYGPITELLSRLQTHNNPYGPIDVPQTDDPQSPRPGVEVMLGCASSHFQPETANRFRQALEAAIRTKVGLYTDATCCGSATFGTGDHTKHQQLTKHVASTTKPLTQLVIADPHCYQHIAQEYPKSGVPFPHGLAPTVSLAIDIWDHALPTLSAPEHTTLAFYHDPPPLGRFAGHYDTPRKLLGRLGYQVLEFTRNRYHSSGTGAGSVYRWTNPTGAKQAANWVLDEVRQYAKQHEEPAPPVISVGETACSHLREAAPDLTILDLNQLVVDALLSR
jgi:Fe-S oxidoreductase